MSSKPNAMAICQIKSPKTGILIAQLMGQILFSSSGPCEDDNRNRATTTRHLTKEKMLQEELCVVSHKQDAVAQQKSKKSMVEIEDQNIAYFYCSIKSRQLRNTIRELTSTNGSRLCSIQEIKDEAVSNFQSLLGSVDNSIHCTSIQLTPILQKTLLAHIRDMLDRRITREEIRAIMLSLNGNKALGPNEFIAQFFKDSRQSRVKPLLILSTHSSTRDSCAYN